MIFRPITAFVLLACGWALPAGELSRLEQDTFHEHINRGNIKKIEELVKQNSAYLLARSGGPDVLPLQGAIRKDKREVFDLLIALGADVNARGGLDFTALREAVMQRRTEMALVLLEKGADAMARDNSGNSNFDHAISIKDPAVVKAMLDTGKVRIGEPNPRDGRTPLINAAQAGNLEILETVLAGGADVNQATPQRQITALHYAVMVPPGKPNRLEVVKALLAKKANIRAVDAEGWNALHRALREENAEMYDILLAKDPSLLNTRDKRGYTPFISACRMGFKGTIEYLVKKGADTKIVDNNGSTGFVGAKTPEIKKLLKDLGVNK